jgi:hypothetical protein
MVGRLVLALLLASAAAGCSSVRENYGVQASLDYAPPMDRERKISEQDCSKPLDLDRGNLRCK